MSTGLMLRLAALTNIICQNIRDGVDANDLDNYADYLLQLNVTFYHIGGDTVLMPLRLLGLHLEAAVERRNKAIACVNDNLTLQSQVWRLESLSDRFYEELEQELKNCRSRSQAALLSKIFYLGLEGIRIWEKAYIKRLRSVRAQNPRSSARNSAMKRKQAPTNFTPENLLPPPSGPLDGNEDSYTATSPVVSAAAEAVNDHDPPLFTIDPSTTHLKTRFAIETPSPVATCAATATSPPPPPPPSLNVFDDNALSTSTDILSGVTPPEEDEFEAIHAMVACCKGELETNTKSSIAAAPTEKNELDAIAIAIATESILDTPAVIPTEWPSSCSVTDPSIDGMLRLIALAAAETQTQNHFVENEKVTARQGDGIVEEGDARSLG